MKSIVLPILFVILVVSCQPQQQSNVIDYPLTGSSNTDLMELYRVEITDTALILYTEVYHQPNYWVQLSSGAYLKGTSTGKTYKLLSCPDYELDKEVYMPESGNRAATLFFEPVDKADNVVSFYEGDSDTDFYIKDIQLTQPKNKSKITCIIEGEVIDRPQSSRLILGRKNTDYRVSTFISIPIRDGKFSYTLHTDVNDAYELIFWDEYSMGGWRPTYFLTENGRLHFTLYPEDNKPHTILQTKAPFNNEIIRMNSLLDSLFNYEPIYSEFNRLNNEDRLYSDIYKEWIQDIRDAKDNELDDLYRKEKKLRANGLVYSEEGNALDAQSKRLQKEQEAYILNYVKEKADIAGYYFLNNLVYSAKMSREDPDFMPYIEIFKTIYQPIFPDHPITDYMNTIVISSKVKVGQKFVDFTAPDLNENLVTLSDQIKGKIALIDLWASWCGPCRRTSISMIPVYEAYKDKGFTIVGIARENGNTAAMKKAIEQDKYPWLNLVELNDAGKIWDLYGVGNAGGSTFLVDTEGVILAIHPTAEEVTAILEQKL